MTHAARMLQQLPARVNFKSRVGAMAQPPVPRTVKVFGY
jgi:hypothetical protein